MQNQFKTFADAIRKRFSEMSKEKLFQVDSDRDVIWASYLSAFPAGTNPIFRERSEHDCSCCRQFIRTVGNIVAIQNGAISSVWDLNGLPSPYQEVADAMSAHIKGLVIRDVYLTPLGGVHGTTSNHEMINGKVHTWDHFSVEVPKNFVNPSYVEKQGELRTTRDVFLRGIEELKAEAVSTVLDLIESKALYRGEEHKKALTEFGLLQARMLETSKKTRELMSWTMLDSFAARFRNTVIGTLVQDLSDGVDLEKAVKSFETKVAPQNYKRPTALITKSMVEAATKTIEELGLEQALERRHARLSDVSVTSVLFVDGSVRGKMKGGLKGLLMDEVKPAEFDPAKADEISIEDFLSKVLPKTTALNLYLDNAVLPNFVSLTAPAHEDSKSLFKWGNDFAWSYDGNVTDSIKEKVKRAGGMVEGVSMRVSLAWNNYDDLDLHVIEPDGNHVYFRNKSGKLDVDMNAGTGTTRQPVENVRWVRKLTDGNYRVSVHNWHKRESIDVGFTVEIESDGQLRTFRREQAVREDATIPVATITVKGGKIASLQAGESIISGASSQDKWGLKTLDLVRVNSVVLSPNHWDGHEAGNRHWFFILDGCKNPLPTRGIYNEFLHPRLEKHRKVFEVLGDKTKCPVADEQLSGVGFSSTRRDKVTVIAMGPKLNKPYTIAF